MKTVCKVLFPDGVHVIIEVNSISPGVLRGQLHMQVLMNQVQKKDKLSCKKTNHHMDLRIPSIKLFMYFHFSQKHSQMMA